MNKSALRTFATSARKELLKKVEAKAMKIGITEDSIKKADIESSDAIFIDGKQLSKEEKIQRDKLIARINQIGFKQVMEEVAYIWFNRFTALRYMEVNEYLPTEVRVLSSTNPNSADPDMLNDALELDLEIDKEYVYELKLNNKTEELFKYLIIKHCNDLNRFLPFMFETIDDYTEILFPEGLLAKDSFIRQMANTELIPEKNWRKVEIIGWLYQYYIAEEKDRVIKAKKKYKTEEIPYATQLFTPDWIVRYMVQNSLGRYWVESYPEHQDLIKKWEFYLESTNPEPNFEEKLSPYINKELKVEEIKCFDPAMGSGHILVYMFDVLYEIYSKCGYMEREIPRLIIENNLYGLDIDDRAYQLACFSVVMKALEYNNRFFRSIEREGLTLNLASIQETNTLDDEDITYIVGDNSSVYFDKTKEFIEKFKDAKTIGSLIKVGDVDVEYFESRLAYIQENPANDLFEEEQRKKVLGVLPDLIIQSKIMNSAYDILITNPPYMGSKYMKEELSEYLKKNYSEAKADTFSAFMEYCFSRVKLKGQLGFVTPFVWMFISSYKKLREYIIAEKNISSLIQLEYNSFPDVTVPVCTFTVRNYNGNLHGEFISLSKFTGSENQPIKTLEAVRDENVDYRFHSNSNDFALIPDSTIAYWASKKMLSLFNDLPKIGDYAYLQPGLQTSNNDMFLRRWFEVGISKLCVDANSNAEAKESKYKWFPYNKGGNIRKWYGNREYVVNWFNDGEEIKDYVNKKYPYLKGNIDYVVKDRGYYFKESITWSFISSSNFSCRYTPQGSLFDVAGSSLFPKKNINYFIGFLNSKVTFEMLKFFNPTMNFQVGDVANLPIVVDVEKEVENHVTSLAEENVSISKEDWDSFETSWDFKQHVLLRYKQNTPEIKVAYKNWENIALERFNLLLGNENELNKSIIQIFGLENEILADVNEEDITLRKADNEREIRSFLSYAIGCMFGRYSLDEEGLIFAGGQFNQDKYRRFKVDNDNILPILYGSYFEDDLVSQLVEFVKTTFGEEKLSENLDYIADMLGRKKGETSKETIRRYLLNDFFKDHVQTYKKRPIYWLFTSGKQKAFTCLIYMHRYDKTTLSRIRTEYLHEYQIRLDVERKSLVSIIEGDSTTKEISNAKKELKTLDKKIEELKEYDELLHHMADMQIEIDLDDGVKVNYEKFKGLVAKI
ncbi:BREX-1 system adenine-specific DNA-methyltransferase PglX [Fredinandcohnia quinoae]|uniref:site-specific DNA-methyltransferase (adenine-specific) n=1 Tax=Fredinandcohnia quinoae TaxID=2918902 RepID=A0AAW5E2T9_9BACI|nr:BREX-1 system adenine-specific DNA-methyltransferase PglX [Fredinandcohnia sp. SECRCQ15]MCH1627227.1 BREX-1 system adenine-specific DNA-methyltransferase PglX [Fredinandcohnia sp. SECRCQ15]